MFPFIGLDCEWVSMGGSPGPVALIQVRIKTFSKVSYLTLFFLIVQIATHQGLCVLVRLCKFQSYPQSLESF